VGCTAVKREGATAAQKAYRFGGGGTGSALGFAWSEIKRVEHVGIKTICAYNSRKMGGKTARGGKVRYGVHTEKAKAAYNKNKRPDCQRLEGKV